MYTENNGSFKSIFIKIVIVVFILFVLMMLFPTRGFITNLFKKSSNDIDYNFNSNLIAMASAGSGYFTSSRLPQNENDEVKMTLKEMLDKKLIVKFTDSNGITCSTKKSYVLVKKGTDEYTMKVNLSCTDKTDYINLHMGLDGTQFPSTSTARCTFVKNLDEAWTYGQWSSWSTEKVIEDGTNQVETFNKKVQNGTKTVARNQTESSPSNRYTFESSSNVYYACADKYDNAGVYRQPVTCTKNVTVYTTEPNYITVTYYRYRSKSLSPNTKDTKQADCNDESLINEGYVKVN